MIPTPAQLLRTLTVLAAAAALVTASGGVASAHGDNERTDKMRVEYSAGTTVPLISSGNVKLVATRPGPTGISGCFMKSAPVFVMSNLDSIRVLDVSDPLAPTEVGRLPNLAGGVGVAAVGLGDAGDRVRAGGRRDGGDGTFSSWT